MFGEGSAPPDAIYPLRLGKGRKVADVPSVGLVHNLVVSSRVLGALRTVECGSLRYQRAIVRDASDSTVLSEDYWVIWPEIGAGPVDRTKGIYLKFDRDRRLANPSLSPFGLVFDQSTLKGLDVFGFPNRSDVVLTTRALKALLAVKPVGLGIANLRCIGDEVDDEFDLSRIQLD